MACMCIAEEHNLKASAQIEPSSPSSTSFAVWESCPEKGEIGRGTTGCISATWRWPTFSISPHISPRIHAAKMQHLCADGHCVLAKVIPRTDLLKQYGLDWSIYLTSQTHCRICSGWRAPVGLRYDFCGRPQRVTRMGEIRNSHVECCVGIVVGGGDVVVQVSRSGWLALLCRTGRWRWGAHGLCPAMQSMACRLCLYLMSVPCC